MLHEFLYAQPELFGPDWLWVARQIHCPSGRVLDFMAIDRRGTLFAVEARKSEDCAAALVDVIGWLGWLERLDRRDLDTLYREQRGSSLEADFYDRFGDPIPVHPPNNNCGLVLVLPNAARIAVAVRTLRNQGVNILLLEYEHYSFDCKIVFHFRLVE